MNDAGTDDEQTQKEAAHVGTSSASGAPGEKLLPHKIRIFVVDDHPVVRKGLQMLLNLQSDLQVCGEAVGVATAKEGISALQPDLVVVDLGLEDGDGFELMDWLHRDHPHVKMLVFSGHDDLVFTERAFRCGAQGYVVKHDGMHELIRAIRLVMQNQPYISGKVADRDPRPTRAAKKT